jgi:hypothetical protein
LVTAGIRRDRNEDAVALAGASHALAAFVSDRASKLVQLTAAVRNGAYWVSSALIGRSLLASLTT